MRFWTRTGPFSPHLPSLDACAHTCAIWAHRVNRVTLAVKVRGGQRTSTWTVVTSNAALSTEVMAEASPDARPSTMSGMSDIDTSCKSFPSGHTIRECFALGPWLGAPMEAPKADRAGSSSASVTRMDLR